MKVSEISTENLAFYLKLDYTNLAQEEILELESFLNSTKAFIISYTGLELGNLDLFIRRTCDRRLRSLPGLYDNRSFYIDKNNLNKFVEMILGMHHTNLL